MKRGHWVDNAERDTWDLGLQGTWTERAIDRIGCRGMVVAALDPHWL